MCLTWTDFISCLLAICCWSGLVACGSLASCFNSGFVSVACGGGYGHDFSSLPQSTATSAEGRWTGATLTGRTVAGLVLEDGSYWVFYTVRGNPNILAGLVHGTGTSHLISERAQPGPGKLLQLLFQREHNVTTFARLVIPIDVLNDAQVVVPKRHWFGCRADG